MGNRKNWSRRNKKANNWKVIRNVKRRNMTKMVSKSSLPVLSIKNSRENDDDQLNANNSKRRKISEDSNNTISGDKEEIMNIPEISESFFASLTEMCYDNDNEDIQAVDPLSNYRFKDSNVHVGTNNGVNSCKQEEEANFDFDGDNNGGIGYDGEEIEIFGAENNGDDDRAEYNGNDDVVKNYEEYADDDEENGEEHNENEEDDEEGDEEVDEECDEEGDGNDGIESIGTNEEFVGSENENVSNSDDESREEVILEEKLSGRRIFDVADLFQKIKRLSLHSKNCYFEDMVLVGETKKGLNSIFKFKCSKCGAVRRLESCPEKEDSLSCNDDAVLGINLIGSGFYHLEEVMSQLSIPCMSSSFYDKISKRQQSDWLGLAKKLSLEALKEVIDLAKSEGNVDSKGNALIEAICDGGWAKRSYGKSFNSLSAVLIGVRTKKVVFFGVRNKYCHTCKIAQSKDIAPKDQDCNINYAGPSSGMEGDIILEGFRECDVEGARFNKLIADGDSSTYKTLRDFRVYKDPDVFVDKRECVNHLHRNFRSKIYSLKKSTKFNSKLRDKVALKANDITKGVKVAAQHWRESDLSTSEKIKNLEDDIMNAPNHYFGVHTSCKSYFCKKQTKSSAIRNVDLLKAEGLYYEVLNLCQTYYAGNAISLLENFTNNAAENFNNIVAKFLCGKRICYSMGRSYPARVGAAAVHLNTKGHACSAFRKYKLGDDHHPSCMQVENKRIRKLKANESALDVKPRNRHQKEDTSIGSYFHGDGTVDVDMTPANFKRSEDIFLKKLDQRQKNRDDIEKLTVDKAYDSYWHEIRQDLLPSSHFYRIVNAKKRESYVKILEEIMYNRTEFGNNAQIKHQRLVERDALVEFERLFSDEVLEECGLIIDKDLSFLCASPLRLYGENHTFTIICPLKEYNKVFEKAIPNIKFFKSKNGDLTINEKSQWYIELQGDMHITNRKFAFIMIWLGESSYRIIEVARNDEFFERYMLEKLTYFYKEVMLKELVDSRVRRHMPIRKYNPETLSFE